MPEPPTPPTPPIPGKSNGMTLKEFLQWVSVLGVGTVLIVYLFVKVVPIFLQEGSSDREFIRTTIRDNTKATAEQNILLKGVTETVEESNANVVDLTEQVTDLVEEQKALVSALKPIPQQLKRTAEAVEERVQEEGDSH